MSCIGVSGLPILVLRSSKPRGGPTAPQSENVAYGLRLSRPISKYRRVVVQRDV